MADPAQQEPLNGSSALNVSFWGTSLSNLKDYRIWLICALFAAIGIASLNDSMLYTPDSPRYLIWAKSLAVFDGFKDFSNPDPSWYVVHAPLYPLLLAPLDWFFSDILIPAKVLTIVSGVALLLMFYLWIQRRTNRTAALLGTLFLAINPLIILFSNHVLSDIPFTVCVVLFFMTAETMAEAPDEQRWSWFFVTVLTLGIFLREIGLTLLLGAIAYLLMRKERRRLLIVFTIPMLFYMIWYFRNEVFIAGVENPAMRNMKIFLGHAFTGDQQSLFEEFVARLTINTSVYAKFAKGLLLFPQFLVRLFTVVLPTDPMMTPVNTLLTFLQYPLVLVQYGLVGWGVYVKWKEMKTTLLVVLFSLFYLAMVLLYPVNDLRFLVPLIVVLLYYAVLGGYDLAHRLKLSEDRNKPFVVLLLAACLFLVVPNATWIYNYLANSREYVQKISDSSKPYVIEERTPETFVRPASLVGTWIADHSDASTTVLARWKELTLWMGGRTIVDTDPLLSLTLFESILRDYDIRYIVALVTDPGIREFEFQMIQTRRFAFTTVYRAGSLEVIEVQPLRRQLQAAAREDNPVSIRGGAQPDREAQTRELFKQGIRNLEEGAPDDAEKIFAKLLEVTRGSGYAALFRGIALEFGTHYGEALRLFDSFRYQPQAGPFIKHAWYHSMLIREMMNAEQDTSRIRRAMMYHKVSVNYWDLGFRLHAHRVLNNALQVEPTFAPAMIFGLYYSLQLGDTAYARSYCSRVQRADSSHTLIGPMKRIFSLMDSARMAKSAPQRIGYELSLARAYTSIGLRDLTIDQTQGILQADPTNAQALELLAQSYDIKGRRRPAIQILERLLAVKPDSPVAREKLKELNSRR